MVLRTVMIRIRFILDFNCMMIRIRFILDFKLQSGTLINDIYELFDPPF